MCNNSDPFGLCSAEASGDTTKVEICSTTADLPANLGNILGLDHMWFRTSKKEAGLGQEGGNVPLEGEYRYRQNSPFVAQTEIVDHSGRGDKPGAKCTAQPSLDAGCVNRQLNVGEKKGAWSPANQCQTFVADVVKKCSIPAAAPKDATNQSAEKKSQ